MALSYTGVLFRRIAICCGAAHNNPHYIWEIHLRVKYREDYCSHNEFYYMRGENGKWKLCMRPTDDKEYEFWKGLRWLEENGYIKRKEGINHYGTYGTLTVRDNYIKLTEKGLAAAPAYIKRKEESK